MDLMEDPDKSKPEDDGGYAGLIIGAAFLPVFIVFALIGKTVMGINVFICLGVNAVAAQMRWDLRKHLWFWLTIVVVTAVELPLVANIPWPHRWVPGIALLPIGLLGYLIAAGAIRFIEKFIVKANPPDE